MEHIEPHKRMDLQQLQTWAISPEAVGLIDQHDVKPSTRKDYKYKVGRFIDYIDQNGFTRDVLTGYKDSLRTDAGLTTAGSMNAYYNAAVVFTQIICRKLDIDVNYIHPAKRFKRAGYHFRFGFDEAEVQMVDSLISLVKDEGKKARLQFAFYLMAFAGFRQIEVVTIQGCNIHKAEKVARVYAKNADELQVKHLPQKVITALEGYLPFIENPAGFLFTPKRGIQTDHLTTRGLRKIFKPYLKACGIQKTLHGLRHYHVTRLLEVFGGDLLAVMPFSGHHSVNAIRAYDDRRKNTRFVDQFHENFD